MNWPRDVGAAAELPQGGRKLVFLAERSVLPLHTDQGLYALDNSCPHQGASLASGRLQGQVLSCPAHGLRFSVDSGQCVGAPGLQLRCWQLRAEDGRLMLSPLAPPEPT